jgi:hypothetical protein
MAKLVDTANPRSIAGFHAPATKHIVTTPLAPLPTHRNKALWTAKHCSIAHVFALRTNSGFVA